MKDAAGHRYRALAAEVRRRVAEIGPHAVAAECKAGAVLIDVREADEVLGGVIPGARQIPRGIAEQEIEFLLPDAGTRIVIYCKSGNRSALVAENLQRMGYSCVKSLAGGIAAWIGEERPIVEPGVAHLPGAA